MTSETPKRVAALTKMRKEMQRRYMLLYRHYRLRKFGEPIPSKRRDEGEEFKEDTAMLDKIE